MLGISLVLRFFWEKTRGHSCWYWESLERLISSLSSILKLVFGSSTVDNVALSMCGAYNRTFLPKPKESALSEIFLEAIFVKEILLSANAKECRHSAILTSHTIFVALVFHWCRTSQVSQEKTGSLVPWSVMVFLKMVLNMIKRNLDMKHIR